MAIVLGYDATLFHNYVAFPTPKNVNHQILIAGIGPVFSLLSGIIFYQMAKSNKANIYSLYFLWMGIVGISSFFGYLLIAPFATFGDTGKVFNLLEIPMELQIIFSVFSIAMITIILIKSTRHLENFIIYDFGSTRTNRTKYAISLILIPLISGIILSTALQFPIPHPLSLIASICMPMCIMAIFGTFLGSNKALAVNKDSSQNLHKFSYIMALLFIFTIIINRLLTYGISI